MSEPLDHAFPELEFVLGEEVNSEATEEPEIPIPLRTDICQYRARYLPAAVGTFAVSSRKSEIRVDDTWVESLSRSGLRRTWVSVFTGSGTY